MPKKSYKLLVTGGAGFIGSEFVRQAVKQNYQVVVVDKLTYAGDVFRLKDVRNAITFHKLDICNQSSIEKIMKKEKPQAIVHFAAETHVDRSIFAASPFVDTNIKGTLNLLDSARQYGVEKFIHISTDEVYGEIKKGKFKETSLIAPNSPYAASKASADLLIKSYIRTHQFPAIIIRPSNNYGPGQYPEKFIPVVFLKAMRNEKIPIYGTGLNVREWLYVSDCVKGILQVLSKGKIGEVYNIGSDVEMPNIEVAKRMLKLLKKPESLLQYVADRKGHDFRYSLDCQKIRTLKWSPTVSFDQGLHQTMAWYTKNLAWLNKKV